MKRILIYSMAALLSGISVSRAQDASALADRQAVMERYQQLAGKLQDLSEAQQSQTKRIEALAAEIKSLRDEINKPDKDKVQRDELRKLAEQVKDIDDKRAADKELILTEIKKLGKASAITGTVAKPSPKPRPDTSTDSGMVSPPDKNYEGYEHVVKSGETLMAVIQAYNKEQGLKLTLDQVLKHPLNANLKPEKMRVGQKIFIPAK
jgi:TolA-binding protein